MSFAWCVLPACSSGVSVLVHRALPSLSCVECVGKGNQERKWKGIELGWGRCIGLRRGRQRRRESRSGRGGHTEGGGSSSYVTKSMGQNAVQQSIKKHVCRGTEDRLHIRQADPRRAQVSVMW